VLNNMGATFFCLGQYAPSRKSYQQALALHRESGNTQAEAETLANLSLLDCVEGYQTSGIKNAQQAIGLAEKAGDKINLANAYYYLGRNQLAAGNCEAAEIALRRALELRREVPHPGRLVEIQTELALVAQTRSENLQALEWLTPVLEILSDHSTVDGTDDPGRPYSVAAQILVANGDGRADLFIEMGKALIKGRAAKISDAGLRQSFLDSHTTGIISIPSV
jgi:tetratricopeptide (TPR) repeat protein